MSIKEPSMLPKMIFEMIPFKHVINAEDKILTEIEDILCDMYSQADIAKSITLSREVLYEIIKTLLNSDRFSVQEYPEENRIDLLFLFQDKEFVEQYVKNQLMVYMPAHLVVNFVYVQAKWKNLLGTRWRDIQKTTWDTVRLLREGDDIL